MIELSDNRDSIENGLWEKENSADTVVLNEIPKIEWLWDMSWLEVKSCAKEFADSMDWLGLSKDELELLATIHECVTVWKDASKIWMFLNSQDVSRKS